MAATIDARGNGRSSLPAAHIDLMTGPTTAAMPSARAVYARRRSPVAIAGSHRSQTSAAERYRVLKEDPRWYQAFSPRLLRC